MAPTKEHQVPDRLIGGSYPLVTGQVTVPAGEGVLARGTVLGRVVTGAIAIAATVGNTGNGVPGAITKGSLTIPGNYILTVLANGAANVKMSVFTPDGVRLTDLTTAVAYASKHFNITIADGAAAWVAGDKFTVSVAASAEVYRKTDKASVDGSQKASIILGNVVDATLAAVVNAPVYLAGQFNQAALVFGGASTFADHALELREANIYLTAVSTQ